MATTSAIVGSTTVSAPRNQIERQTRVNVGVLMLSAGTAACIADLATFPLDTAKVRLQVQGESATGPRYSGVFGTILGIARNEGPRSLYNGLVPGLQRQMVFSAIRIGGYDHFKHFFLKHTQGKSHQQCHLLIERVDHLITVVPFKDLLTLSSALLLL